MNVLTILKKHVSEKKDKKIHLEILRIIACFFVIFIHTGKTGYVLFIEREIGSLEFWIYEFISVFSNFAVPIFFMISGAIMLGREEESLKKLWKNRILKIFIALVVF